MFAALFTLMTLAIEHSYPFLYVFGNPVSIAKDKKNVAYVLEQYSLFPKHIVSMLTLALKTAKAQGWTEVAGELERNIGQELGSDSLGSHYQMLATSMQMEFDLNVWAAIPSSATDNFVRAMWAALRSDNPLTVLGAAYALESTAVPELRVVLDLVGHLAKNQGRDTLHPETQHFFDRHLNTWEPSHEKELRKVCERLIVSKDQWLDFYDGFNLVLSAMGIWWQELAKEAAQ